MYSHRPHPLEETFSFLCLAFSQSLKRRQPSRVLLGEIKVKRGVSFLNVCISERSRIGDPLETMSPSFRLVDVAYIQDGKNCWPLVMPCQRQTSLVVGLVWDSWHWLKLELATEIHGFICTARLTEVRMRMQKESLMNSKQTTCTFNTQKKMVSSFIIFFCLGHGGLFRKSPTHASNYAASDVNVQSCS